MNRILSLSAVLTLIWSTGAFAQELSAQEYCKTMGDGLSPEDAKVMIAQCMEEQSQYYDDNSTTYEDESTQTDCYHETDAKLEKNPELDYESALQACFNQHS